MSVLNSKHILMVDDEDFLILLWETVLEKKGYQITSFLDSRLALEAFRKEPERYDLVLTDQSMPFISGSKLAEEMLKLRNDIKIILCSGYLIDEGVEQVIQMGISKVLLKPFDNKELIVTVKNLIG